MNRENKKKIIFKHIYVVRTLSLTHTITQNGKKQKKKKIEQGKVVRIGKIFLMRNKLLISTEVVNTVGKDGFSYLYCFVFPCIYFWALLPLGQGLGLLGPMSCVFHQADCCCGHEPKLVFVAPVSQYRMKQIGDCWQMMYSHSGASVEF